MEHLLKSFEWRSRGCIGDAFGRLLLFVDAERVGHQRDAAHGLKQLQSVIGRAAAHCRHAKC